MYKCTTCVHVYSSDRRFVSLFHVYNCDSHFVSLSMFAVIADCEDLSYTIHWDISVPFDNVQCLLNGRNLGRCELVC